MTRKKVHIMFHLTFVNQVKPFIILMTPENLTMDKQKSTASLGTAMDIK